MLTPTRPRQRAESVNPSGGFQMFRRSKLTDGRFPAAGTALGAALGLLMAASPAQAEPVFPLAPTCKAYEFPNVLQISHDNNVTLQVPTSGKTVGPGRAMYAVIGRTTATFGNAYGGINGRSINFTVNWDEGIGAGYTSTYTGQVNNDGIASGTTRNNKNETNSWRASEKFRCADAPAPPSPPRQAPPPPPSPSAQMATVAADVDVYERPNLNDDLTPLGILRRGKQVELVGSCQRQSWCQVKGPDVPGGQGFVWGHLQVP